LGFSPDFKSVYQHSPTDFDELSSLTEPKGSEKWIGIAPFAKHMGKVYPEILMTKVVEILSLDQRYKVFIFGGGLDEQAAVNSWIKKYPTIISAISKLTIDQQLLLMSQLDIMVSMDSGNMHLASLVGTPVISVWGATHPYAGFLGWNQSESNIIQTDLPCRPCSVFGDKPCFRKDYACMYQIKPETIIQKIEENLSGSR
jgi:ADP-heptose:LPS heptosyltransferase